VKEFKVEERVDSDHLPLEITIKGRTKKKRKREEQERRRRR
jgi:hypothetical protein